MKIKNEDYQDIDDYYSIKAGPIWQGLKNESAAFWWLCIYVFFEYVRPQSVYPVIDILPWTQIALLLACVTAVSNPSIKWVRSPLNLLLILFLSHTLLSSAFAYDPSISWNKISVIVNWVLVYFLTLTVVNSEKRLIVFFLLFLLVNFKMSQHGFFSFANRGFGFASYGVKGSPGWFSNSGEFGIAMTIFVPLSIAFIMALKSYWGTVKRYIFYFMPFTGLMTIVATSSRGGQLAIAVVGLWFLLKSKAGFKYIFLVMILAWGLFSILPEEQKERFESMGEDETSTQRLEYWKFGMDIMQEHPGLGIGYGNWLDYCWYVHPDGLGSQDKCEMSHNSFVEVGAELGYTGLIIYLFMLFYVFKLNARTREYARKADNKLMYYLSYGLDGGMVGYLISSFFIAAFFYPFFWYQMSLTVALHYVASVKYHAVSDEQRTNVLVPRFEEQ